MACASTSNNPITIIDLKKKHFFCIKYFQNTWKITPAFPLRAIYTWNTIYKYS